MPGTIVTPILVGRNREMVILDRLLKTTQDGIGGCVLLTGEAGIGKSRLATELREHAISAHFWVMQGYCSELDVTFPYAPWIDALRAFLAPKSVIEVEEVVGPFSSELVKLLPELSLLLPPIQPAPPLDPAAEKHRLFETLVRFAVSLAAAHPLLIVLEDLHWSDEQSLEFLHFFTRRTAAAPILILGTHRKEELFPRLAYHLSELNRERLVVEIPLAPLARPDVSQMIQAILRTENPISPDWLDLLMPLTEGNPFVIEEMTKSLVQTEARPGPWDPFQIPRSLQQTVQHRIEELTESARTILSLASVIGERFEFELLQKVTAEEEPSLLQILKELISAQLIVELTAEQYAFRHTLTREVVYAALMLRERKAMHQMIGETMEQFAGPQAELPAAPLAYHFYRAGEWHKALKYSQRAGEKAQALYAPREALAHFTHALEAAQQLSLAPRGSSLRGRAQAYEVLGEFDRARADYEAALKMASQGTNRIDKWQSLIDLGFMWQSRDLERAGEYYQRALELARKLDDQSILAQTLNRVGNWYFNRGQALQALPYHQEALALFQERGDRRGMAHTMDLLGIVSYQLGEVIQGADYLEQAVPMLHELDDRQGLVNALTNLTVRVLLDTEVLGEINYLQLTNLSDEALQIARGCHWYQGEVLALMQGAICLEKAGAYGQALERLTQAQSLAEESRNRESFARLHLIFGQIFSGLLAMTEAKQHFETGLTYLQELGSGLLILAAKGQLAEVAVWQSDFAHAHTLLADLLPAEYPEDQEQDPLRRCWSAYAELELAQGNPRRALGIVDRLLAATPNLAEYGLHAVPRLSRLRGQALAALGRMEDAEAELQGTLPVARKHGQHPLLWRLHTDLGKLYRTMGRRDDAEREFALARTIIQDLANSLPVGLLRDNFLKQALAIIPDIPVLTPRQITNKGFGGLTAREREIAVLIAQGKSNREIADKLVISETTVERHIANIFSKLGFNSRTQIAVWSVEKGLGK